MEAPQKSGLRRLSVRRGAGNLGVAIMDTDMVVDPAVDPAAHPDVGPSEAAPEAAPDQSTEVAAVVEEGGRPKRERKQVERIR